MEGIWFYWFTWIGWIIVTFFHKKNSTRTYLTILFLFLIITADISWVFINFEITLGYITLFISAFIYSSKIPNKKLPYLLICTLILTMAYVCFYLFSLFDPVWVLFNPKFMLGALLTYIVLLLMKEKELRFLTFAFGVCYGELVHFCIMKYYSFPYILGSLSFFDVAALGLLFISSWNGLEIVTSHFNHSMNKTNKRKAGIL
ncbi:YphA family membrane protein [Bacillus suaedaesalsae]|uniref:Uncharacterized protein n=1 Tax=Bacillus suaedaesalsae TaxID=2810349 RepID=A0ABS2DMY9_9BACI|nr:hypothetical protein [Bacillus suaedaesalsae]MBM6619880.1 hypothetical protein [Bacillus suaedaesalsae]